MLKKGMLTTDRNILPTGELSGEIFICFCFAAGCLMGAFSSREFIGVDSEVPRLLDIPVDGMGIFLKVLKYIRFHILALFFGTSLAGVALIPALAVVRGFVLSLASASVLSTCVGNGLAVSLVALGLPAMFSVPCFILLSEYSLVRSRRLVALCKGRGPGFYEPGGGILIMTLPVLFIGALIDIWLVPKLLLMIN